MRLPRWWFGAPLVGFAFSLVASRYFPGVVESIAVGIYQLSTGGDRPASLPAAALGPLAFLIGVLLAVAVFAIWRAGQWAVRRVRPNARA